MKTEEDISFYRLAVSYIGEKLLILGSCILVRKNKVFIRYKVKIIGYSDSPFLICPTYQISEILNVWKHF